MSSKKKREFLLIHQPLPVTVIYSSDAVAFLKYTLKKMNEYLKQVGEG